MARRNLHVRISEESYDAWRGVAARYGVSLSAILEAMGERFVTLLAGREITALGEEIVNRAREIDKANRSRSPTSALGRAGRP